MCPYNTIPDDPSFSLLCLYTMSSSPGKKTTVPTAKRRKGAASSPGPTAKIRHPLLEFPLEPQEELFKIFGPDP
ncbi:hypothetical protein GOBAR_AA36673 [Gossypium barbadense]|uniref:Uncharacterized protein n=1 Tax=Gossypium barbadense TaxID=3634 RepID=A0A2P5VYZ6_GOSBA|nr:hypothetical protein GOBAR_AA36673 [Gossypium barbadense]